LVRHASHKIAIWHETGIMRPAKRFENGALLKCSVTTIAFEQLSAIAEILGYVACCAGFSDVALLSQKTMRFSLRAMLAMPILAFARAVPMARMKRGSGVSASFRSPLWGRQRRIPDLLRQGREWQLMTQNGPSRLAW
jgi:hypothetical protein